MTRFECVGFSMYTCAKIKMSFTWKIVFFLPNSASIVSRSHEHLAKRKRIGWSNGFNSWTNWTMYGVISRSLCKICVTNVFEIFNCSIQMFNCWERRTLSATEAIFSGVCTVFGSSRFGLSMMVAVSFSFFFFFSKNNEHTVLTVLLFFQNPYTIFAHILQHYHDFQSNVAILPSVVQAYTQPFSFSGRIKQIIRQIIHDLRVTIQISTCWKKKRQMADPMKTTCDYIHTASAWCLYTRLTELLLSQSPALSCLLYIHT